jgi:LemA protein
MKRLLLGMVMLSLSGCGYNRIQTLDEQVTAFASQIKVQLQRRADLIPNLVETVETFRRWLRPTPA